MKKVFNPFDQIETPVADTPVESSQSGAQQSTSGVNENVVVGQCSRCGDQMEKVGIKTPPDLVYFCEKCRITTPLTDAECQAYDTQLRSQI